MKGHVSFTGPMQDVSLKLSNIPSNFSFDTCIDFINTYGFSTESQSTGLPTLSNSQGFFNSGYASITFQDRDAAVNFVSKFDGCKYPLSDQIGNAQIPNLLDVKLLLTEHPLGYDLMLRNIPAKFSRDALIGFIKELGCTNKYVIESVRLPTKYNIKKKKSYNL